VAGCILIVVAAERWSDASKASLGDVAHRFVQLPRSAPADACTRRDLAHRGRDHRPAASGPSSLSIPTSIAGFRFPPSKCSSLAVALWIERAAAWSVCLRDWRQRKAAALNGSRSGLRHRRVVRRLRMIAGLAGCVLAESSGSVRRMSGSTIDAAVRWRCLGSHQIKPAGQRLGTR